MDTFSLNIPQSSVYIIALVAAVYVILITLFGGYFARFNKDINDFFYSGQRFSWWLPAASMMATGIGSYSFLKYSEQGFSTGMNSSITYLNDWFAIPFFIFGWLPIIYYARIKSIPEYFERRFNTTARLIALVIILAYMFFYIGYNLFTVGLAIEGLFGVSQQISVPIIALFLGTYVTFGGQTAVIFTDFFQGLMLFVGGTIAIFAGITALGGIDQFWSYLPTSHRLPFLHLTENENYNTAGLFWGEALAGSIAFAFLNQGFIMRYLTIKSVNDGKKAAFFNLIFTMPLCAVIVGGMGWIAKALVTKQAVTGGALAGYDFVNVADTSHTFLIVCWITIKQNPWIFGFIIASLLAALMSTIDTLINACAALIVYDIYKPYFGSKSTDAKDLRVARIASVACTLIGLCLVVILNMQKDSSLNLMSLHYKGIMIIIPSIVTTVFLGVFWRKFHAKAACLSMILGSALTIFTLWRPELISPVSWFVTGVEEGQFIYMRALFGMLATGLIGVFFTYTLKDTHPLEEGLTVDSIDLAKQNYKQNSRINEEPGEIVRALTLEVDESVPEDEIVVPQKHMDSMRALDGDIIYISDNRRILGGLRAGHVKATGLKGNGINNTVRLSSKTLNNCYLLRHNSILLEKIM